jgi:hypothetical protein
MVRSKSSRNILIKTITSYLDLILHCHFQSSPPGSAYTDPSVSATFQTHSGSLPLLGRLVPSAFPLEFPQLYEIFINNGSMKDAQNY